MRVNKPKWYVHETLKTTKKPKRTHNGIKADRKTKAKTRNKHEKHTRNKYQQLICGDVCPFNTRTHTRVRTSCPLFAFNAMLHNARRFEASAIRNRLNCCVSFCSYSAAALVCIDTHESRVVRRTSSLCFVLMYLSTSARVNVCMCVSFTVAHSTHSTSYFQFGYIVLLLPFFVGWNVEALFPVYAFSILYTVPVYIVCMLRYTVQWMRLLLLLCVANRSSIKE